MFKICGSGQNVSRRCGKRRGNLFWRRRLGRNAVRSRRGGCAVLDRWLPGIDQQEDSECDQRKNTGNPETRELSWSVHGDRSPQFVVGMGAETNRFIASAICSAARGAALGHSLSLPGLHFKNG